MEKTKIRVRLREVMDAAGMKRGTLARKTGLRFEVVNRWYEGDIRQVDLDVLERMCEAIGCQPSDVLDLGTHVAVARAKDAPHATTREQMRRLKAGDTFVVFGRPHTASCDAHVCGDASYGGHVVYDESGIGWMEEAFPSGPDMPEGHHGDAPASLVVVTRTGSDDYAAVPGGEAELAEMVRRDADCKPESVVVWKSGRHAVLHHGYGNDVTYRVFEAGHGACEA